MWKLNQILYLAACLEFSLYFLLLTVQFLLHYSYGEMS
jgi:hypothetical protein